MRLSFDKAVLIATAAHADQVDKAGAPYISHPLRVAKSLDDYDAKIVAVLHDVVEDTDVTFAELINAGLTIKQYRALSALTHSPKDTYHEYLVDVSLNDLATEVKLADLEDNLDLSRISNPTDRDYARLAKYKVAKGFLTYVKSTKENE